MMSVSTSTHAPTETTERRKVPTLEPLNKFPICSSIWVLMFGYEVPIYTRGICEICCFLNPFKPQLYVSILSKLFQKIFVGLHLFWIDLICC